MHYIIFDLEATCWKQKQTGDVNEIIEIGAVKLAKNGKKLGEFDAFVQPIKSPILSNFCTKLTGIQQENVNGAAYFPEVSQQFKEWIGVGQQEYLLCSWGAYDRNQLTKDCTLHGLPSQWAQKHINIKMQYAKLKKLKRGVGLQKALKMEKLIFEGRHHRGIDDAQNIARIFLLYLDKWKLT